MERTFSLLILAGALMLFAAACNQAPDVGSESSVSAEPEAGEVAEPTTTSLDEVVERALADGWQDLRIATNRRGDAGLESLEIFASGAGVWNGERQIELPDGAVEQALRLFAGSGFADLPMLLDKRGGELAKQVRCRVLLELDGHRKEVTLLEKADPVAALLELSDGLFDLARPVVAQGRGTADLAAGLSGVAAGELAPELLRVLAHRKPELGQAGEGWLLDLRAGRATLRRFVAGSGYGDPETVAVSSDQLREFAGLLLEDRVWELPANLAAEGYRELKVGLLNHESAVVARTFAGRDPEAEIEARSRLDAMFAALEELLG